MYERGTVEYDQSGRQVRRLGMVQDITERKQAEEELREKSAFLEAQVDSSLDGILVVDNNNRKILQNQRMNELWKIPPAIVADPDDAQQIAFVAGRTRNPQTFVGKVNYLNSHPDEISRDEIELVDGTILDRFSSPVRDKGGKHYGRIWAFRDITDQRRLEMQLRQAQKMEAFGQLAGGVAHDFNNILAVIQMQAGLLKVDANLSLEQKDFAGEIEKAAERGANLTRQLLLFSRQQTMQPRDLRLNEAVENMAKMLRRTLGEQFDLQFKFAPHPLFLHADSGMIDQILLNLTVNARDAMPKGGQILIETSAADFDEAAAERNPKSRPGAFVCLRVTDHGSGIAPEILPRIFEPFFTTKGIGKGTSLGLATVFGIVQQHKGWIDVSSEVGTGTTIQVYLPRLKEKTDTEIIHRPADAFQGDGGTLLIVEDEAPLRNSLRVMLQRMGYRVLEAASGDEALGLWENHQADIRLVLTDLVMPGNLSGRELGERLLRQNPRLKIIYASGYSQEIVGGEWPLAEGVNYLAKPFDSRKLAQIIRQNLEADTSASSAK
jgi:signal transduction histidine kinase/ActR/RegA family two-component response regulator